MLQLQRDERINRTIDMDNGALVFIIVFEAIIIVWLASKLKHYQKFEHLLSASDQRNGIAQDPQVTSASQPAAADGAASNTVPADSFNDELLEPTGEEPEVNIEEAKRVQWVMARCRYAEFYLEQLDDDYERGQFRHIVESCMKTARGISDPFFKASALHPVILLLDRAGWEDSRDALMSEVEDDIVRQRISAELSEQDT